MPITSSYFLPAVILNPVVVLHAMNTYLSYQLPPVLADSVSPHATIEKYGPLPGSAPYFDVHSSDQVCWTYTIIMVIAQIFAYFRVGDNRIAKKAKLRRDGKKVKHSRWSEPPESPTKVDVESHMWVQNPDKENDKVHGVNGKAKPTNLRKRQPRMVRQVRTMDGSSLSDQVGFDGHVSSEGEEHSADVHGDSGKEFVDGVEEGGSDEDDITTETSEDEFIP